MRNVAKILFIAAVLVLIFPFLNEYYKGLEDKGIVENYLAQDITEEEQAEKEAIKEEYNKSILTGAFNSKGEIEDLKLKETAYIGETVKPIGILYIPRLNEEMPIYMGVSEHVLDLGVGIIDNTSIPGGKGTHSVLSGHRGTHNAQIFRHLDEVEVGDVFYVIIGKEIMKYEIKKSDIKEPDKAGELEAPKNNEDRVTLLTCTPYLINTERLLLYGYRTELTEDDKHMFAERFQKAKEQVKKNEDKKKEQSIWDDYTGEKKKELDFNTKTYITLSSIGGLMMILLFVLPLIRRRKILFILYDTDENRRIEDMNPENIIIASMKLKTIEKAIKKYFKDDEETLEIIKEKGAVKAVREKLTPRLYVTGLELDKERSCE